MGLAVDSSSLLSNNPVVSHKIKDLRDRESRASLYGVLSSRKSQYLGVLNVLELLLVDVN